ncbi:hypothetical protein ACH3VR_08790 [Microbacterium sp. B2969]|uniref:Uncharacterized protein n=1 Tax=Microbacterium alkaliflavum TaxID=3248839 RepID=A0ABW7Q6G3_9MICO
MDAATRAELAALRRRAYARDADIAGDSVGLERLAELEQLALAARAETAPVPAETAGLPRAAIPTSGSGTRGRPAPDPVTHAGPTIVGRAPGRLGPRRRLIAGLVASVALLAVAFGPLSDLQTAPNPTIADAATASPTARPATADLTGTEHVIIPLVVDRRSGEFIDVSPRPDMPVFLANDVTTWVQPLGVHYGWTLSAAGISSGQERENCLLLTNGSTIEAKCRPRAETADGALRMSLGYGNLADHQRPQGMTPDQRVTFTWGDGAYISIKITDGSRP